MLERFSIVPSIENSTGVAKNFELLTPERFLQDFCNEVQIAVNDSPNKDKNLNIPVLERPRIGLEAMWIEFFNKAPKTIFASLYKAVKTGFALEIHEDWYSKTLTDEDLLFLPPTKLVNKAQKLHRMWVSGFSKKRLELLEDEGAKILLTNIPERLIDKVMYLFRGRNHKKIIFVKSKRKMCAWLGGMNLAQEHFRQLDFMVKIDDPRIVKSLIEEFDRTDANERTTNAEISITGDTSILVDTGKEPSLILKRAIEDVDSAAKTVYVSSAFLVSGKFLNALYRAKKRGVKVAYVTSSPKLAGGLLELHGKISDVWHGRKKKIPVIFLGDRLVHAKSLVVDGKRVIIGSHNFIDMPHEELSLRSEEIELVNNVTEFLRYITKGNLDSDLKEDLVA